MATSVLNSTSAWEALLSAAHAWQFRPNELRKPGVRDRCLSFLSETESVRYTQFPTTEHREEYLAARALCRASLSRYTGIDPCEWRFQPGVFGKPAIVEPNRLRSLRFNLAHTVDLVICIVSRAGEVGVDVEETSQTVDPLLVARHFFSRRQQSRLAGLPSHERALRFFEQWALKEAYVKATGKGLAHSPERLTIEQDDAGQPVAIRNCQFSLHRPSSAHVAAAAVLKRNGAVPISIEWMQAGSLVESIDNRALLSGKD